MGQVRNGTLIETYLQIAAGNVDRKTGIHELSKELRKRAIDSGKKIDEVYRNENGISMQLGKIEYLMLKKPDAQKHNTKIFIDMVDMYTTDRDQFNRILVEAKGARPMASRQDNFFAWLSREVPSFRMADYFLAVGELENFARKKHLLSDSLFNIVDPAITGEIVTAVRSDRIFRFTHKKQMKSITELAQYFHNYTKAQAVNQQSTEVEQRAIILSEPTHIAQSVLESSDEEAISSLHNGHSDQPASERDASLEVEIVQIEAPKEEINLEKVQEEPAVSRIEEATQSARIEKEYEVDFVNKKDYAFTTPIYVSYFGDKFYESSWRNVYVRVCRLLFEDYPNDFEYLRDNYGNGSIVYRLIHTEKNSQDLHTPVKIGDNFYVETNRSASDLMRYIKYLLDYCGVDYENVVLTYKGTDGNKEYVASSNSVQTVAVKTRDEESSKDPVILFLKQYDINYMDYRSKGGCLWILGGPDIADKMNILQKNGIRVYFKAGGGNVTGGKDLLEEYGNVSQLYSFARSPKKALKEARETIASCIGALPEEIFFTSGGTESDNWAIKGTTILVDDKGGIITSAIEHHAVLNSCHTCERLGTPVAYLPVASDGTVMPDTLERTITQNAKLVSVMLANNEIGSIQPIRRLAEISHAKDALFHTDAVQALGHIPVDVQNLEVD